MQSFHDVISSNMVPIIFAYGLTFFAAGFAIALQPLQLSKFRLAHLLWMLAAFGIIHGVAEWGDIFIPIQSEYLSDTWIHWLWDMQQTMWAVSYIFLLQFGATVTAYHLNMPDRVKSAMLRLLPVYGIIMLVIGVFFLPLPVGQSLIRYMLAFPAAIITAVSFMVERRTFSSYGVTSRIYMTLTAVAFGAYAFLSGIVVPERALPGMSWLNYENVFTYTLMPIFFWRMVLGICFTILIIRTLHMFDIEYRQRLETVEAERALVIERQRIARDLHDGVVQAIYASGLQLEVASKKAATRPEEATSLINHVVIQLNEVITNIRRYIYNLAASGEDESGFENYIKKIADEFSAASSIPVKITIHGTRINLTPKQKQNIAFITQEGLSNILKHSGATEAEIRFDFMADALAFSVRDNGSGYGDSSGQVTDLNGGRGLRGMKERAAAIDADIKIGNDSDGSGTLVSITIPYKRSKGKNERRY